MRFASSDWLRAMTTNQTPHANAYEHIDTQPKKKKIGDPNDLLMSSLAKFYNKQNMNKVLPIIEGNSDISLRLIDWFVTNYSKKNSTIITKTTNTNNIIHFNVYLSYRSQLKAYSKQQFDPFRRRDRITFVYDRDGKNQKSIETTVGQLNFFKWVLQNNLLDYITEHYESIEADMIQTQKSHTRAKPGSGTQTNSNQAKSPSKSNPSKSNPNQKQATKKRNELSKSFIKNMNRFQGNHTIAFN